MVLLICLLVVFSCPSTMGQMFNSLAEMLNPQLLNLVFGNFGPIGGGQTVNIGTGTSTGSGGDGQTLNIGTGTGLERTITFGTDGNTDSSPDDSSFNFQLSPLFRGSGPLAPVSVLPPLRGPTTPAPSVGATNQSLGQITQLGIGNTLNVASPSQPGPGNTLIVGQLTQRGVGNVINVGPNQTTQAVASPSSNNLEIGQLQQRGIGNTANFGGQQQDPTNGLPPGQTSAMDPQSFGIRNSVFDPTATQTSVFGQPATQNSFFDPTSAQTPVLGPPATQNSFFDPTSAQTSVLGLGPPGAQNSILRQPNLFGQQLGNTAFGRPQQPQTNRLLPGQFSSQPFGIPPLQNSMFSQPFFFEQAQPSPFQMQPNPFPSWQETALFQRSRNLRFPPRQRPFDPFRPNLIPAPFIGIGRRRRG